jgi:hypothetical protein
MANKRPRPDEIVTKLRKIEKLTAQGMRLWMRSGRLAGLNRPITAGMQVDKEKRPVDGIAAKQVRRKRH